MPDVKLNPLEAKLVALAFEKRQQKQAVLQEAWRSTEQVFASDVSVIAEGHQLPIGTQVNFHLDESGVTMTWPDIAPASPECTLAIAGSSPATAAEVASESATEATA